MAELSDREKQDRDRSDFWIFVIAVLGHWHRWAGYVGGLGVIYLASLEGFVVPMWVVPWFAASGLVVGAFLAWRDERRSREALTKELALFKQGGLSHKVPEISPNPKAKDQSSISFFLGDVLNDITAAIEQSQKRNIPIFAIIYNPEHPKQSKLSYSLGYFLEYDTTKDLIRKNFIQAILDSNKPDVARYIPQGEPLENCLLVVLAPDGTVVRREGVYANPDEGFKRVKEILSDLTQVKPKPYLNDPFEWPSLTDTQIEQWISELRPYALKSIKVATGPSVELMKFYRNLQGIGKALGITIELFSSYPNREGEFRIQAANGDTSAVKLSELCKVLTDSVSVDYQPFPPSRIGELTMFIGEKPQPPHPTALRIELDAAHLFDANVNGACYWRVDVISKWHEPVIDCMAYLTKIERNGEEKWGKKKALLTFEPGSAANTCKTINPKATEILDIIASHNGAVIPATWPRGHWPYREKLHTIFEVTGDYVLTVDVEAKNALKTSFQYKFTKDRALIHKIAINPTPPSLTPDKNTP